MRPSCQALPAAPAPASTSARVVAVVASSGDVERGVVFEGGVVCMGVAFRDVPVGAPGCDYLGRGIVDCGGAPVSDTAFMGLTSGWSVTIARTLARSAA